MATEIWPEVWTRPGDPNFGRVRDYVPFRSAGVHVGLNRVGDGNFEIADSWDGYDDLLQTDSDTPANSSRSLVRWYSALDPTTPFDEWLPNLIAPGGDKDDPYTKVTGVGINGILGEARLEPFDWDGSDSFACQDCDWSWGSGVNLLQDPSFDNTAFPNGGFEEGNANYWTTPEGGSITAIEDPIQAQAGDFYGLFNPAGSGSIVRRQVQNLKLGETYTITGWLDDLDGTGDRWRFGVSGASNATHTNAYEVDGIWYAELGNAPMGTGSSTGVYQQTTVTFVAAENPVEFFVEYLDVNDHNSAIDSFVLSGASLGVSNWRFGASPATMNIAEVSTEQAQSGTTSLKLQGSQPAFIDAFGRISYVAVRAWQPDVALKVGKVYTSSVWVYHTGAGNETFSMWASRTAPQGPLAPTVNGGFLPAPGSYHMAASTVSVPPNTWTKLQWTSIADTSSVRVAVAWNGGSTDVGTQSSPTFYVDDYELYEGLPATTIGDILTLLYDHATNPSLRADLICWDDGSGTDTPYLTLDFTDTLDSAGNAWADAEIRTRLTMRMSYSQIMASLVNEYRYEYRVVPNDAEAGTWLWQVYNPGGMDAAPDVAVQGGSSDIKRQLRRATPGGTDQLVEGLDRVTARARNTALMTALGRIEAATLSREAPDLTAAASAAASAVSQSLQDIESVGYVFTGDLTDEPMSAYTIGDTVTIVDPPQITEAAKRFVDLEISVDANAVEWECQYGALVITNADAAVADAVAGLLQKFEYPDLDTQAPGGVPGGGGGAPTVVVAASDASDLSKSKANLLCTGVNDHAVIQQAIDLLPTRGGRVLLTEGRFFCDYGEIVAGVTAPLTLQGMGMNSTLMLFDGTTGAAIEVATAQDAIRDLWIFDASGGTGPGVLLSGGQGARIQNVLFDNAGIGVQFGSGGNQEVLIVDCLFRNDGIGIDATPATGTDGLIVANNHFENVGGHAIDIADIDGVLITGNYMNGLDQNGVNISGPIDKLLVSGNRIRCDAGTPISATGSGHEDWQITDNYLSGPLNGITLDTATINGLQIQGNSIEAGEVGIRIDGGDIIGSIDDNFIGTPGHHGIHLTDVSRLAVRNNQIDQPGDTDDTYDGILLDGDSDECFILGNSITGSDAAPQPRYGINVSAATCDCNRVVGNNLGPVADYGTDALNDAGTNTQLFWPNDVTYGDNFTDCPDSS